MDVIIPMPTPEKVFYTTSDGVRLCAIFQPAMQPARGIIVLAHGLMDSKDEPAFFPLLASAFAHSRLHSLRFDFRAHGESEGEQQEMTLEGQQRDLIASIAYASSLSSLPLGITAFSLGAVSACCYAATFPLVRALVLLSPVLDLRKTFLQPELPWAQQSFHSAGFAHLAEHGYLLLDGRFKLGQPLIEEMGKLQPYRCLSSLHIPVLTIQGNKDSCVPYDVSHLSGVLNLRSQFITVSGAEHGFDQASERECVIGETVAWFIRHLPSF